jgi:quinol monooxygenase YgiN
VIVVTGWFRLASASDREAFLAAMRSTMERSRAEDGCIDYTMAPDPLDDTRVVLSERWESQQAIDAHLAAMQPPDAPMPALLGREVLLHTVASTAALD